MNALINDFLIVAVVVGYLGISALVAYLLSDKKRGDVLKTVEN